MTALLSILALLIAASILRMLETGDWPIQRNEPLYDSEYWQTVRADSLSYLHTHTTISEQIRREVMKTIALADRRLGGTK